MNKNLFKAFMIVTTFLLLIAFVQRCNTNNALDAQGKKMDKLQNRLDSFITVDHNKEILTAKQVRNAMNDVIYNYLIYQAELNNGRNNLSDIKKTLSDIKKKIEANGNEK